MDSQILDQLQRLKDRFSEAGSDPDNLSQIDAWMKSAENALIIRHLAEHEGMKPILSALKSDVADMNTLLRNADSQTLNERQRDRVLDRRNLYESFIHYFDEAQGTIQSVEEHINANKKWTE